MQPALPSLHLRLRRMRRLCGIKQLNVAMSMNVDQSTVSSWELGERVPSKADSGRLLKVLTPAHCDDSALRRLVESSLQPVHLISDIDHRLLAASKPREARWQRAASQLRGQSLWRFATAQIQGAEASLAPLGWWDSNDPRPVHFWTSASKQDALHIQAGELCWERVWLASGEPGRLCWGRDRRAHKLCAGGGHIAVEWLHAKHWYRAPS